MNRYLPILLTRVIIGNCIPGIYCAHAINVFAAIKNGFTQTGFSTSSMSNQSKVSNISRCVLFHEIFLVLEFVINDFIRIPL